MKTDTQDAATRPAHTPGPWKVVAADDYYISADSYPAHDASRYARDNTDKALALIGNQTADCGEANARLIAAAPDMLSALKAAKTIKEGAALKSTSFKLEALIEIGKLLDAAIAKAGGQ